MQNTLATLATITAPCREFAAAADALLRAAAAVQSVDAASAARERLRSDPAAAADPAFVAAVAGRSRADDAAALSAGLQALDTLAAALDPARATLSAQTGQILDASAARARVVQAAVEKLGITLPGAVHQACNADAEWRRLGAEKSGLDEQLARLRSLRNAIADDRAATARQLAGLLG